MPALVLLVLALCTGRAAGASPFLSVFPQPAVAGQTATVAGAGFCGSCGDVQLALDGRPLKRSAVTPGGSFSVSFTVPAGGTHEMVAVQRSARARVVFVSRGAENEDVQEANEGFQGSFRPETSPEGLVARVEQAQQRAHQPARPVPRSSRVAGAGPRTASATSGQLLAALLAAAVVGVAGVGTWRLFHPRGRHLAR